jgi:hypothetical protein
MLISKIKEISNEEDSHFIHVDFKTYRRYKILLNIFVKLNPKYKSVKIFRNNYKQYNKIVIIGLRYYGRNVRRRTKGFAKKYLRKNPGKKCIYCNRKLTLKNSTAEHIIPISKGGSNSQVNLLVCCGQCNGERGDDNFYNYLYMKNPNMRKKYPFV